MCVCASASMCVGVSKIIQTLGWHGWIMELAHIEGDVPDPLPVSDSSLNQE